MHTRTQRRGAHIPRLHTYQALTLQLWAPCTWRQLWAYSGYQLVSIWEEHRGLNQFIHVFFPPSLLSLNKWQKVNRQTFFVCSHLQRCQMGRTTNNCNNLLKLEFEIWWTHFHLRVSYKNIVLTPMNWVCECLKIVSGGDKSKRSYHLTSAVSLNSVEYYCPSAYFILDTV